MMFKNFAELTTIRDEEDIWMDDPDIKHMLDLLSVKEQIREQIRPKFIHKMADDNIQFSELDFPTGLNTWDEEIIIWRLTLNLRNNWSAIKYAVALPEDEKTEEILIEMPIDDKKNKVEKKAGDNVKFKRAKKFYAFCRDFFGTIFLLSFIGFFVSFFVKIISPIVVLSFSIAFLSISSMANYYHAELNNES